MAQDPGDRSGLTAGDPLAGAGGPAPPRDARGAPDERPPTPEAPAAVPAGHGYGPGSPVPPGAGGFGTPWSAPPAPVAARYTLAGWWRRAGAAVLDGLIVGAVALVFILPLGLAAIATDSDTGVAALIGAIILCVLVFAVVGFLYAPVMLWKTNGKTLGRMATGIRLVRADGRPMSFGTAVLREVVLKNLVLGILSSILVGIPYLLDYLWPLWDEENRAGHDFPVNTRTILG